MLDRDDHLNPYLLHELATGSMDASESERVRAHLEVCGRCRAEFALAQSFVATPAEQRVEPGRMGGGVARARRRPPALRVVRWGLLAASIALVAVGVREFRAPTSPFPESDGVVRSVDRRGHWLLQVERSDAGWALRWSSLEGATAYTVQVLGPDGRTVWTTETDATEFDLRSSVIASGATVLFVRISARLEDGDEQVSGLVELADP